MSAPRDTTTAANAAAGTGATNFGAIWNMSFGFLGIQFGWGLQMANMSAIYEYLGASADQIPMLWLAAPLTGLIVQPIIGHLSDRTWSPRFGRRRPFFLVGAILSSHRAHRDAQLQHAVDGGRPAVDPRCVDQHLDGAVPRVRGRPAAAERAHPRLRHAEPVHRAGRGDRIGHALDADQLVRRRGQRAGHDPARPCSCRSTSASAAFFGAVLYTILTTKEKPPADLDAFERAKAAIGRHRPRRGGDRAGRARDARDHAPAGAGAGLHLARALLHVALLPGRGGAQRLRRARCQLAAVPAGRRVGRAVLRRVLGGVLRLLLLPAAARQAARREGHALALPAGRRRRARCRWR